METISLCQGKETGQHEKQAGYPLLCRYAQAGHMWDVDTPCCPSRLVQSRQVVGLVSAVLC